MSTVTPVLTNSIEKIGRTKNTLKLWLFTSILAGFIYLIIWAIPRLTHYEKNAHDFAWHSDHNLAFWISVVLCSWLFFLLLLGLPIFIFKTTWGNKLALLAGSWIFYFPVLAGSLLPSIFGIVSGERPPVFIPGSFIFLFGELFNFMQAKGVHEWIEWGRIDPNLTLAQVLIATGIAITIVSFVQALKVPREKRLLTDGLYATVKRPQHLGIALWTLGFAIGSGRTIGFMAWFTIFYFYILLAIGEERKLEEQFGETYQVYRQNTPFMIPFINIGISLPAGGWKRAVALLLIYLAGLAILCLILALVGVSIMDDIRYH